MANPEFRHTPLQPQGDLRIVERLAAIAAPELGGMFAPGEPILGHNENNVMYPDLTTALSDPNSTTVILEDENGEPIGFSWAVDDEAFRGEHPEENTAYLYLSVITPEHRGNHAVGPLVATLMRELRNKGYKRLRRDVVREPDKPDGYASKVMKHFEKYPDSILDSRPWEGYPGVGPQLDLMIDIDKYLEAVDSQS